MMRISLANYSQLIHVIETRIKRNPKITLAIACTAIPAIEMAIRGIGDVFKKYSGKYQDHELGDLNWNIGTNIGGALLYGMSACIPATRFLGAVLFVGYSIFETERNGIGMNASYIASKCIYIPIDYVGDHILLPLWNKAIAPISHGLWNNVFYPVLNIIGKVVKTILHLISQPKLSYFMAGLITAIFIYRKVEGNLNLPYLRWKTMI